MAELCSLSASIRTATVIRRCGAQVFYYTDSEEGRTAAGMIQAELNALAPDNEKEIRANDSYYILKNTRIPTVIVEWIPQQLYGS